MSETREDPIGSEIIDAKYEDPEQEEDLQRKERKKG